jgi:hypothetical protein
MEIVLVVLLHQCSTMLKDQSNIIVGGESSDLDYNKYDAYVWPKHSANNRMAVMHLNLLRVRKLHSNHVVGNQHQHQFVRYLAIHGFTPETKDNGPRPLRACTCKPCHSWGPNK